MSDLDETFAFENLLANERQRLVRLCAWFTGSPEAAEDLAQETLLAAWKNRHQLISQEKLKPWLSGIARNVCLNWSRQNYRELAHRAPLRSESPEATSAGGDKPGGIEPLENRLADETDLELDLDRAELAGLLDQALALLPPETAHLLVEHYIQDTPHIEIANKLGLKAGTVAVKLQRGKLTLRHLLQTRLKAQSAAFGLVDPLAPAWEETNIWCPVCGQARLLGQYQKDAGDGGGFAGRFALRCPACNPEPDHIMVGLDLSNAYNASLLGNVKSYKPAYTRLITGLGDLFRQALAGKAVNCPSCGQPARVSIAHEREYLFRPYKTSDVVIHCPACGWASSKSRYALMLSLPEMQRFWRENPRMRTLPGHEIEAQGALAVVTRVESITGAAELAVLSARDTFEILGVHSNLPI